MTGSPRPAPPCVFVLFGANGDLTQRLVFPALYNLAVQNLLPKAFAVLAVTRSEFGEQAMRDHLREGLGKYCKEACDRQVVDDLVSRVSVAVADAGDPDPSAGCAKPSPDSMRSRKRKAIASSTWRSRPRVSAPPCGRWAMSA